MLILAKSSLACMISFFFSLLIGLVLIPVLKKFKIDQVLNIYLERSHESKKNTPTMGGLIFILGTILTVISLVILKKITLTYNFFIVIWTFISYGLIGLLDDYLIIKRHNNIGLTKDQKFFLEIIVAVIFFYLFLKAGNETLIWIHSLNIKINIGPFYGLVILFMLVASSNAVNLTDGLDGLAGGLSAIAFFTYGLISWNTGWLLGYEDIALLSFIILGSLLAFLVFNVNPAKVFMGDTGSLALGAALASIALLTRHELYLALIGIVFVIETFSVLLQVSYFKLTKGKRLFKMTPLHHSFEKSGISERDIVKLFWIVGLIGSLLAITLGVWI